MHPNELEAIKAMATARRDGRLYDHPLRLTPLLCDVTREEILRERQAAADANPLLPDFDACYGDCPPSSMVAPGHRRQRARAHGPRVPIRRRKASVES